MRTCGGGCSVVRVSSFPDKLVSKPSDIEVLEVWVVVWYDAETTLQNPCVVLSLFCAFSRLHFFDVSGAEGARFFVVVPSMRHQNLNPEKRHAEIQSHRLKT